MPAHFPDPEDFNPILNQTWFYHAFSVPLPPWLAALPQNGGRLNNGKNRGNPWNATLNTKNGAGSLLIIGNPFDPKRDGELKAKWVDDGKLEILIGVNQRRLKGIAMELASDPEAYALDLLTWNPTQDQPSRVERRLLELKVGAKQFLADEHMRRLENGANQAGHAKTQDSTRKKLNMLRDDAFVHGSRNLQEPSFENRLLKAVSACFAENIKAAKLEPPTQGEVKFAMAEMSCADAGDKNPGTWSYAFNHLGFAWL